MQYKASRARIRRVRHSEARKNLTKIGAGNLGRNQSRLRLPGPPTGPLITNLMFTDRVIPISCSGKITKLRLWILSTNELVLHRRMKGPETRILSSANSNTLCNIQYLHQKQRAKCRTKTSRSCEITYTRDLWNRPLECLELTILQTIG